jgi:hypothetical protein
MYSWKWKKRAERWDCYCLLLITKKLEKVRTSLTKANVLYKAFLPFQASFPFIDTNKAIDWNNSIQYSTNSNNKYPSTIPFPKCANTTPPPTTAAQLLPPLGHSATEAWSCDAQLSSEFRSRASLLNRDSVGFVLSVRLLGRQEGIFGLRETVWGRLRGRKGFGLRGIGCLHWKGSLTSSLRVIVCRRRKSYSLGSC